MSKFSKAGGGGSGLKAVPVLNTAARLALTSGQVAFGDTVVQRQAGGVGDSTPSRFSLAFQDITLGQTADLTVNLPDGSFVAYVVNGPATAATVQAEIIDQSFGNIVLISPGEGSGDPGSFGFSVVGPTEAPSGGTYITVTDFVSGELDPEVDPGAGDGDGVYTVVDVTLLGDAGAFIKCG